MNEVGRRGLWRGRSAVWRVVVVIAILWLLVLLVSFIAQQNISA
jgi:hypothetical protein